MERACPEPDPGDGAATVASQAERAPIQRRQIGAAGQHRPARRQGRDEPVLRRIPPGTTTTYGAIAREVDSPDASRAVGMANGANPVAIIVPCHRVIGSNGTLTGYGGGLDKKSWLLDHERRWSVEPALF